MRSEFVALVSFAGALAVTLGASRAFTIVGALLLLMALIGLLEPSISPLC